MGGHLDISNHASSPDPGASPRFCHTRSCQWKHRSHWTQGLPRREICLPGLLPNGLCVCREHHPLLQPCGGVQQGELRRAFVKASRADGGLEGKCKIPLLADRSGKISKKYGVFDAEEGIARKALVIIDDRGTARHMVASSLPVDKVIDDTLKVIQTFQSKSLGSGAGSDVQPSNFPIIKSKHSLVVKHVTREKWEKLKNIKTKTSGFTLYKAIAVSVEFDNQHCGIYAGDWDSYKDFAIVFDPLIQEYHGILPSATHTSDMDSNKIKGNVASDVPVHSCRIRVGRSIDGFGLSPGITKEQRKGVEALMKKAFANMKGDLSGTYYP